MNVLVFKTNIRFKKDLQQITPVLGAYEDILRWNVDRHDSDKVLRVETTIADPHAIIRSINAAGYQCEELPD